MENGEIVVQNERVVDILTAIPAIFFISHIALYIVHYTPVALLLTWINIIPSMDK